MLDEENMHIRNYWNVEIILPYNLYQGKETKLHGLFTNLFNPLQYSN